MLRVVEEERALRRYVRRFESHFRRLPHEKKTLTLGHRGKSYEFRVYWIPSLGLWLATDWKGDYYRHVFGLTCLNQGQVSITCEINFPRSGIDRKVGGAFAVEPDGHVFVVHRGLLGGRKGIGKTFFVREYRGLWAEMEEKDTVSPVVVVGELTSVRFARQLSQFVRRVAEIKESKEREDSRQLAMPLDLDYAPHILGWETYEDMKRDLPSACDLGLVVEDLVAKIESRGLKVKPLGLNCLLCPVKEEGKDVYFYILPDSRPRSVREGATHLFFLALRSRRPYRLLLVVPEILSDFLQERLREFSIETIVYRWIKDRATFAGLDI